MSRRQKSPPTLPAEFGVAGLLAILLTVAIVVLALPGLQ